MREEAATGEEKTASGRSKVEENIKAVQFNEFLMEKGIRVFSTESMEDEANTVFFRTRLEIGGQLLPAVIIIDAGIFIILRVQLVGGVGEGKRERITRYLNELNLRYKTFKYYLTGEGTVCLDMCISLKEGMFEAEFVYGLLGILVGHLEGINEEFMEHVWQRE